MFIVCYHCLQGNGKAVDTNHFDSWKQHEGLTYEK